MYAKRYGNAVLSSMIFLAIISSIAIGFFRMVQYSMEIQSAGDFQIDIYNMDTDEENILKGFMDDLNLISEKESVFENDFEKEEDGNLLTYCKEEDMLTFKYIKKDNSIRERRIYYKFEDRNIVLIPSYTFYEKQNQH